MGGASDAPTLETYLVSSPFGDSGAGLAFVEGLARLPDERVVCTYFLSCCVLVGIKIRTSRVDIIRHAGTCYLLHPHDLEGSFFILLVMF